MFSHPMGSPFTLAVQTFLLPMCSSRIFMVSQLTFKSFIHFEFIPVYGVSYGLASFFIMCMSNFPNTIYL